MSNNGYVALSEKVTATFYDDEHEEWTQKTMTIADVLDSVCNNYTVVPSVQPEIKTGRWIYEETQYKISSYRCSECGRHVLYESKSDVCEAYPYCHCGAKMLKNDEVYANEWLGL